MTIKKEFNNILDSKQDFLISDKANQQKGFLYEFNFKVSKDLSTEDLNTLIENFKFFGKMGKSKVKFTVHLIAIPSMKGYTRVKLTLGLSSKRTLEEINENVTELFKSVQFDKLSLINKRIVRNKTEVSVDEYLDVTNSFLKEKFPNYFVTCSTFESINDEYIIVEAKEEEESYSEAF